MPGDCGEWERLVSNESRREPIHLQRITCLGAIQVVCNVLRGKAMQNEHVGSSDIDIRVGYYLIIINQETLCVRNFRNCRYNLNRSAKSFLDIRVDLWSIHNRPGSNATKKHSSIETNNFEISRLLDRFNILWRPCRLDCELYQLLSSDKCALLGPSPNYGPRNADSPLAQAPTVPMP